LGLDAGASRIIVPRPFLGGVPHDPAIVRFPLKPGTTLEDAKALFEGSAPKYRAAPGLVRKYYLFGEDGTGGGVYLWESREAAERMYSAEWKKMIADRYGTPPQISYFDTPVIVDNADPAAADRAA
jgi:hypothetical protein